MKRKPMAETGLRQQAEKRLQEKTSGTSQTHKPKPDADPQRLLHELEVHQVELEMQNDELRRAQGELEMALERYTDLYDHAPAGYLTLKPDGIILQANLTATRLLGIEQPLLAGRRFATFVAADSRAVLSALLARAFESKAPESGEVTLAIKGKPPITVQLQVRVPEGGQACRVALTDITERKRGELQIAALANLGQRLNVARTAGEAGHIIVDVADQLLGWDACLFDLYSAAEDRMLPVLRMDLINGRRTECNSSQPHQPPTKIARRVIKQGGQLILRDHPDTMLPEASPFGVLSRPSASILFVPIRHAAEVVGILSIQSYTPNAYDDASLQTLQALADHAGGALERLRAGEALRESELFTWSILNSLTAHIAVLDAQGVIVAVNEAWRRFARENEGAGSTAYLGANYLAVCEASLKREEDESVAAALRGLRAVMHGTQAEFSLEYPCHSPSEERWFRLQATRFPGEGPVRLVVAHENITQRKRAEEAMHALPGLLLRSQDEERRRIARELHDTTAQGLAALLMNLSLVKDAAPEINDKAQQLLAGAVALAEQCARELRTLSYMLHPPMLDELGLAGAMRDYVDGFGRRSGLRIDLELPPDLEGLPYQTQLGLFRVMQEALANVRRHSGSRTASVRLARTAAELRLEIQDQGRGMAAAEKLSAGSSPGSAPGVGLPGMRERMRQLGGDLELKSDDHGTCIVAIVPITGETPAQLQP